MKMKMGTWEGSRCRRFVFVGGVSVRGSGLRTRKYEAGSRSDETEDGLVVRGESLQMCGLRDSYDRSEVRLEQRLRKLVKLFAIVTEVVEVSVNARAGGRSARLAEKGTGAATRSAAWRQGPGREVRDGNRMEE